MSPSATSPSATTARTLPRLASRLSPGPVRRTAAASAATLALASIFGTVAALPASAAPSCDTAPDLNSTVTCTTPDSTAVTVPVGTTSVDVTAIGGGGGAGYPARSHIGGNAAKVSGVLTLPSGTTYLYVVVGAGGGGDNHGYGYGGGGSGVFALDSDHTLLSKLVIAGGGGAGSYNGDGGDAGSAGTSENAALAAPGQPGDGATGGAGGNGNYSAGSAGASNNPTALTVAGGGAGGTYPNNSAGGQGGGGYGGGGGGATGNQGILNIYEAGGGGGSSLVSAYVEDAAVAVASNTGGVQLPGLVAGDGAAGSVKLTFHGPVVPGAPTDVTATPGHEQASVSFTAPSDGGSAITGYTVTATPGGATQTCASSPCVVTGLTDGTAYSFTVHATNANGDSAESSASNTVTPAQVPGVPTAVQATGSDESASVSWTAPSDDGGSPVTGYTVTASPGGKTKSCTTSPCLVTGLTNGTEYTFTVVATNAIGDSAPSDASSPTMARTVPDAPSITDVTHGNGSATVTFDAPAHDGGSAVTGYSVVASPGGASVACPSSPCTLTGLANGQTYTLQVLATNAAGSSEASAASDPVTPATVPDAPTSLSVERADEQADLTFEAAADGGSTVTGYQVSVDGGQTWDDLDVHGSAPLKASVTGLTNGTKYSVAVRAVNAEGHGAATEASDVTPAARPGKPTGVTGVRGNKQVSVAWTSPSDNGAAIDGYTVKVVEQSRKVSCDESPCVVDGLTNGETYHFAVSAHNEVGDSEYSDASDGSVPATTPDAPTLAGLTSGDGSLVARFTPTADDGGDPVTGYEYKIDDGDWEAATTAPIDGSDDRLVTVTGLTNGTAATLRLRAVNGVGAGTPSDERTVTPATTPGKVRSVEVESHNGSTKVSWKAPTSDGGSPVVRYVVVAQPAGEPCVADGDKSSCTFTDLTVGATYTFSVTAVNTAENRTGTGSSDPVVTDPTLITDVPTAPTGFSVNPGDRTATLTFMVPSSDGGRAITGYEASTDDGKTWRALTTTELKGVSSGLTGRIVALDNGSTYPIRVRALNADGAGAATAAESTYLTPWFTDPISPADRATEIPVPAKPSKKGKLIHTVATNRAQDGTVAMNAPSLAGRQLQTKQAVQLSVRSAFSYDSAKLTKAGKKVVKAMASSLTYVDAIQCEGYADYAGSKKRGFTLSKARAAAVCKALKGYAPQVGANPSTGYGWTLPAVVGKPSHARRDENRRVVVVIKH